MNIRHFFSSVQFIIWIGLTSMDTRSTRQRIFDAIAWIFMNIVFVVVIPFLATKIGDVAGESWNNASVIPDFALLSFTIVFNIFASLLNNEQAIQEITLEVAAKAFAIALVKEHPDHHVELLRVESSSQMKNELTDHKINMIKNRIKKEKENKSLEENLLKIFLPIIFSSGALLTYLYGKNYTIVHDAIIDKTGVYISIICCLATSIVCGIVIYVIRSFRGK